MQQSFILPLIVFVQIYFSEITIKCDNSLAISIKISMLFYDKIEIFITNPRNSLA